jgi:hypothetical protein
MAGFNQAIGRWSESNPLLREGVGDAVSLIPFAILILLLYLTGREKILVHRETT